MSKRPKLKALPKATAASWQLDETTLIALRATVQARNAAMQQENAIIMRFAASIGLAVGPGSNYSVDTTTGVLTRAQPTPQAVAQEPKPAGT